MFDYLNNAWSKIKDFGSDVANSVYNTYSGLSNSINRNSLLANVGGSDTYKSNKVIVPTPDSQPVKNVDIRNAVNSGGVTLNTNNPSETLPFVNFGSSSAVDINKAISSGGLTMNSPVRPLIDYSINTPQNSESLQRTQGFGGISDNGVYRATEGLTGLSGVGNTLNFGGGTPVNITNGMPGFSGSGNYNGVIGAVGFNPSNINTSSSEDERNKKTNGGIDTVSSYQSPYLPPEKSLKIPSVPTNVNFNTIENFKNETAKLLNNPLSMSANDRQRLQDNLEKTIELAKNNVSNLISLPNKAVVETPEQINFLKNLPPQEQFNYRQEMDRIRSQIGLPDLESSRLDLLKSIQSTNEGFQTIFDDIKNDPNLPKGLAQRRLAELEKQQKQRITALTDQFQYVSQQISDANTLLNREMNIVENDQTLKERAIDNTRQMLNTYISSGMIGSFSDSELKELSDSLNIPLSGLTDIRDKTRDNPKLDIVTATDQSGKIIGIDKNTGETIWTSNVAKKTASTNSGATKTEINNLSRAGLINYPTEIKNYFLSTPSSFQEAFARKYGGTNTKINLGTLKDEYDNYSLFGEL